jgi:hypothetical protein
MLWTKQMTYLVIGLIAGTLLLTSTAGSFHVAEAQSKTYKMNTAFDNTIKGWIGGIKLSVKNLDNGKTLGSKNFSSAYINSLEEKPAVTFSFKAKGSADEDWLRVCVDQRVGTGYACAYRDFSPNKESYHLDIDLSDFTLKDNDTDP